MSYRHELKDLLSIVRDALADTEKKLENVEVTEEEYEAVRFASALLLRELCYIFVSREEDE